MALYNIELRTDTRVWEALEVESGTVSALRVEMAKFVGDLLRDHAEQIWADQSWRIDVTDSTGLIMFVMHVLATDSAATVGMKL